MKTGPGTAAVTAPLVRICFKHGRLVCRWLSDIDADIQRLSEAVTVSHVGRAAPVHRRRAAPVHR